jgi:DNA-binding PadR family transcriptional regulator
MRAEVLKGHLDGLLLAALEGAPRHGYAVMEALRHTTGTIYPALHRLERAKLITASWASESGRRRRVYRLTAAGRRALAGHRAGWAEFSTAMATVLAEGTSWPEPS